MACYLVRSKQHIKQGLLKPQRDVDPNQISKNFVKQLQSLLRAKLNNQTKHAGKFHNNLYSRD